MVTISPQQDGPVELEIATHFNKCKAQLELYVTPQAYPILHSINFQDSGGKPITFTFPTPVFLKANQVLMIDPSQIQSSDPED